jgi:branched-chain amino acid transport system ATP-binding protein
MTEAGTASPNRLSVEDLSVGYGELAVARNLNLAVSAGEVLLLIGPNGAGKTTTLLTIAGALPALAGNVYWAGRPLTGSLPAHVRNGVGFVLDEKGSITRLTVAENLRLSGGSMERALGLFPELQPHLSRRCGLLSGGQQKMLSLAIALSRAPAILLADELSLGLAPQIVTRLLGAVRAAANEGAAVVMVEQHARRALEVADSVAVMAGGAIALAGRVAAIRDEVERVLLTGYLGVKRTEPGSPAEGK